MLSSAEKQTGTAKLLDAVQLSAADLGVYTMPIYIIGCEETVEICSGLWVNVEARGQPQMCLSSLAWSLLDYARLPGQCSPSIYVTLGVYGSPHVCHIYQLSLLRFAL